MLSETAKYQAEVSAESNRLIKQGVPPWEAAMQAGKNVQQKRKLTKLAPDAGDSGGIPGFCLRCEIFCFDGVPPSLLGAVNARRWA